MPSDLKEKIKKKFNELSSLIEFRQSQEKEFFNKLQEHSKSNWQQIGLQSRYWQHRTLTDFTDQDNYSLFSYATMLGNLKEIKKLENLLSQETTQKKVNWIQDHIDNKSYFRPIALAFIHNQEAMIDYLLDEKNSGIDPAKHLTLLDRSEIEDPLGKKLYDQKVKALILEPFKQAVIKKDLTILEEMPSYFHKHYLNIAAEINDVDFINWFFQTCLSLNSKPQDLMDMYFKTNRAEHPLVTAVANKQYAAIQTLMKYLPTEHQNSLQQSALHIAAAKGDWQSAEILLTHNIQNITAVVKPKGAKQHSKITKDFETTGKPGALLFVFNPTLAKWQVHRIAYHVADNSLSFFKKNLVDIFECRDNDTLNDLLAKLSKQDQDKQDLQELTSFLSKTPSIIGLQADINLQNKMGETPLHTAIKNKQPDMVIKLLATSADIQQKDFKQNSVFHLAQRYCPELVSQLKNNLSQNNKALIDTKNLFGLSPEAFSKQQQKSITQSKVIEKIKLYHHLERRDLADISDGGYCNGFTFLYNRFDAKNRLDIYYAILDEFINWDPKIIDGKWIDNLGPDYDPITKKFIDTPNSAGKLPPPSK